MEVRELHTKQQPSTAKHSLLLTSCCLFLRMERGRRVLKESAKLVIMWYTEHTYIYEFAYLFVPKHNPNSNVSFTRAGMVYSLLFRSTWNSARLRVNVGRRKEGGRGREKRDRQREAGGRAGIKKSRKAKLSEATWCNVKCPDLEVKTEFKFFHQLTSSMTSNKILQVFEPQVSHL